MNTNGVIIHIDSIETQDPHRWIISTRSHTSGTEQEWEHVSLVLDQDPFIYSACSV